MTQDTYIDRVRHWAETRPDQLAFCFLEHGERQGPSYTFAQLDEQARMVAAALQERQLDGHHILLMYPPGLDFIFGFLGCLYAGCVPVPVYPPSGKDVHWLRLAGILEDSDARAMLTTESHLYFLEKGLAHVAHIELVQHFSTDQLDPDLAQAWQPPKHSPQDLVLLQYTSGSTGQPKGVAVTDANLMANQAMIAEGFGHGEHTVVVGWLPLYHDMGLIGNVLQPLYLGRPCYLMSPMAFIQKPIRWLKAISRYGATTSGAPNFAYEMCVKRIREAQREGLDLSSWQVAYNGSEPINPAALKQFSETYAPFGFRPQSHYPCYGMAETTLFTSGGKYDEAPNFLNVHEEDLAQHRITPCEEGDASGRLLVGCGQPRQRCLIVDPDKRVVLGAERVGEIWLQGPHVARGYWNKEALSQEVFEARLDGEAEPFLRTGDLGFMNNGELFITGRLKDIIIIKGRNHYPQDLELSSENAHRFVRHAHVAAFSQIQESEERLIIVAEVKMKPGTDVSLDDLRDLVRQKISQDHAVRAHEVVLVKPGGVPKTSSGKVRRSKCKELWQTGQLPLQEAAS